MRDISLSVRSRQYRLGFPNFEVEKRYFERFLGDGRRITLIGVGFSKKTRNLSRWLIEPV